MSKTAKYILVCRNILFYDNHDYYDNNDNDGVDDDKFMMLIICVSSDDDNCDIVIAILFITIDGNS